MEILALLLLGLIAMLAIVPPIIRGKIEESPLATTQSFQRSMEEIAHSIESGSLRSARSYAARENARYRDWRVGGDRPAPARPPVANRRGTSAAARRNRVFALLTLLAFAWGAATLFSGKTWCLFFFATFSILLIFFWLLTIIVPYLASPTRSTRGRNTEASSYTARYRGRQAM